jgi:hypothetical protein
MVSIFGRLGAGQQGYNGLSPAPPPGSRPKGFYSKVMERKRDTCERMDAFLRGAKPRNHGRRRHRRKAARGFSEWAPSGGREEEEEEECRRYLEELRWPEGISYPRCEARSIVPIPARWRFYCRDCPHFFSVTSGTAFHNSHLPIWKWFLGTPRGHRGTALPAEGQESSPSTGRTSGRSWAGTGRAPDRGRARYHVLVHEAGARPPIPLNASRRNGGFPLASSQILFEASNLNP